MLADINNPINFDKKNALIQLELTHLYHFCYLCNSLIIDWLH